MIGEGTNADRTTSESILLVYPPISRSAEPPLGIARIAGFLRQRGHDARCLDLCQEGIEYLLGLPGDSVAAEDTWSRGAIRRRDRNLALLGDISTYASADRYRRVVLDLNRALRVISSANDVDVGLADYRDSRRSPLKRSDLLDAAADFGDNVFFPLFSKRLEEELASHPSRVVGMSICFLSQALCAFSIIGYLRKTHPELHILLGGGLVTSWRAQGRIDARENFGGLVNAIVAGRGEEGILQAIGNAGATSQPRATSHRSQTATPDFCDFERLEYLAPRRIVPYNFSWGCPWRRCSFCPERTEGGPYAGIRVDTALAELQTLAERHDPGLFHFTDNEIAPLYLRALAGSPPGVRWYGFARFTPLLADQAFCDRLAASGCAMLQLGLESGDQRVLDELGKGTRLEKIDRAIVNLSRSGIGIYLYLLFGTPAEDRDAALRTLDFVAARASMIAFLNVAIFNLPAASEEAERLDTRPFYEGDLSLYREFRHPSGWDRDEVRGFLARDFEAEPSIKTILARNPPIFTSSHAPFFLFR